MLVDLHAHALPGSGDARMDVAALAREGEALGLEAVAMTDHGVADLAGARVALAARGITMVPGREISCDLGHVLVLATDLAWLAGLPPRCDLPLPDSRVGPCALVWAHPMGWRLGGAMIPPDPSRGAEHLHAVEVLNGERLHQTDGVELAAKLASSLGLPSCGGSDAHDARALGRCLTEVPGAGDPAAFIEGLAAGDARPVLSRRWAQARGYDYVRSDLTPYLR
ncbi:MAG TPA: PHP-associated domain-containing protein [Actinomycetota bacterium]|nr:PHP-associated domain-containing protein [Actinomycetota bacterium]